MSETEQEPQEPQEPQGPEVEPEPEQEPVVEPEPPVQPTEPSEPSPELRDDVDVEVLETKLETKAKNYTKALADLLEGTGYPVAMCEMCADAYPGIRWVEPRDENHAALLRVVQTVAMEDELAEDPNVEQCSVCAGWGVVKLPSHVPNNTVRTCRNCNGTGYRELHPQSGTPQAPAPPATNGAVEPYPGVPLDDPVLQDYRARGFTVIPPSQIAGTAE
jgi:hypothetical protein